MSLQDPIPVLERLLQAVGTIYAHDIYGTHLSRELGWALYEALLSYRYGEDEEGEVEKKLVALEVLADTAELSAACLRAELES